jgi:hypothetical protein
MTDLPVRNRAARTGTNVRGGERRSVATLMPPDERVAREQLEASWQKLVRRWFTKTDRKRAAEIFEAARQERDAAVVSLVDAEAIAARKAALRRRVLRELGKALPRFREFQALLKQRRKALARLNASRLLRGPGSDIAVDLLDLSASADVGSAQLFQPPFPLYDVDSDSVGVKVTDASFTNATLGILFSDLRTLATDDGPLVFDLTQMRWPSALYAWAECGVNYVVPAAGRLRIVADLRNHFNDAHHSLEDRSGPSGGDSEMKIGLSLRASLRGGASEQFVQPLIRDRLSSSGDDVSRRLDSLPTSRTYRATAVTTAVYARGDVVRVLAGVQVTHDADLDDMRAHGRALMWWELQRIWIEVA